MARRSAASAKAARPAVSSAMSKKKPSAASRLARPPVAPAVGRPDHADDAAGQNERDEPIAPGLPQDHQFRNDLFGGLFGLPPTIQQLVENGYLVVPKELEQNTTTRANMMLYLSELIYHYNNLIMKYREIGAKHRWLQNQLSMLRHEFP